jgi:hypothetical protein
MNQQQWREKSYQEWVGRTTGARSTMDQARGDDARRAAERAARARSQPLPKPPQFNSPVISAPTKRDASVPVGPVAGPSSGSHPMRRSTSSSVWSARLLGFVGLVVGYGYGAATNPDFAWMYALAGALAGAFALDVLTFAFKLVKAIVVAALIIAGAAVAIYVLSMFIGG